MFLPWIERFLQSTPSVCQVCARWPSEPVCAACLARFALHAHRCSRCAIEVAEGVHTCGRCLRDPPPLDACFAAVPYAYPWSGLLSRYKFKDEPGWGATFATLLRGIPAAQHALAHCDRVVPMPLSRQRLATRGFNQALLIARDLAAVKVDARLLLRLRDTPPQSALGRKEREANVKHAFAVDPSRLDEVRGTHLVLIDDVMTSGASMFAAASALRAAGCTRVTGLVVARTDESG